jgi:hypothetical protein
VNAVIEKYIFIVFPIFFIAFWLVICIVLSASAGWYGLAAAYPDRDEQPLLRLKWLSGSMGLGVHMNNILNLAVCPSGLRVGIMRIFGPFSRDFLVPWAEVHVTRKRRWYGDRVLVEFGYPPLGRLTIPAYLANRLARAADRRWPEPDPPPTETPRETAAAVMKSWLLGTAFAAGFFILAPRLMTPNASVFPPVLVAVLFPGILLGIGALIEYFRRRAT